MSTHIFAGISETAIYTASECRAISVALPFVLDGLLKSSVFIHTMYNQWRISISLNEYNSTQLEKMFKLGSELQQSLSVAGKLVGTTLDKHIKIHVISHWKEMVLLYGSSHGNKHKQHI